MIIFLDIDGVLHPEPCSRPELRLCELPRLERVLRDFPQAQVVISSTWRDTRTLADLQRLFSADVAGQVIGTTPHWRDLEQVVYSAPRQTEVEAWLKENCSPWARFAVLDDRAWLFSPFYAPLLKCDPATGMDDQVEKLLRARLKAG
mgnify:CR=1 FL=1